MPSDQREQRGDEATARASPAAARRSASTPAAPGAGSGRIRPAARCRGSAGTACRTGGRARAPRVTSARCSGVASCPSMKSHRVADEAEQRERDQPDGQHDQHRLGEAAQDERSHFERMVPRCLSRAMLIGWQRQPRPPRPAVAGHARPLPHLALGGDAAADAGERGDSLLRALPGQLSDGGGARRGVGGRGPAAVERAGLLRARPQPAQGCRRRSCAKRISHAAAETIAELPGVGRSTAAAIAAFAFGERAAILDGNVEARARRDVIGVHDKTNLWPLAERLLPKRDIETYTQGLMDLGATVCTAHTAIAARCPVKARCIARKTGRIAELPAPRPKKALPLEADLLVCLHPRKGKVLLERRPSAGIWGGLWCFPEAATSVARPRHAQAAGDRAWLYAFPPAHPAASLPRGANEIRLVARPGRRAPRGDSDACQKSITRIAENRDATRPCLSDSAASAAV